MAVRRRAATLQDVATLAGVSVRTVSNVVNDYPHVHPDTRSRVQEAVAALGYRINPIARNLRVGSTRTLGLSVPKLAQPYYAELADTVLTQARPLGYQVIIEPTDVTGEPPNRTLSDLTLVTDGLLLSPSHFGPGGPSLGSLGIPVVVLAPREFDTGVDHVTMDDFGGAQLATRHLLGLGRRRIAVIGTPAPGTTTGAGAIRWAGFRDAMNEAGLVTDPQLLRSARDWTPVEGHAAISEIIASGVEFDAVFALNDYLAIGCLSALNSHGYSVPSDVAVMGFDDVSVAQFTAPPLSTISPGRDELVRIALERLLARIAGEREDGAEELTLPCTLAERASTAL